METFPHEDELDDRTYAEALRLDAVCALALAFGLPALFRWLTGGAFSAPL